VRMTDPDFVFRHKRTKSILDKYLKRPRTS
jgi:hypothetical protein